MIGPLQLLVIGFDEDTYAKEIMVELKNLRKHKIIRLFDLLYIIKHADGTIASKEVDDLQETEQREFGTLIKGLMGLATKDVEHMDAEEIAGSLGSESDEFGVSESEVQGLADQLPDGSSAIFVIFEHLWARDLKASMLRAGGYVRAQGFLDPATLQTATNELAIVLEAVEKAEVATMEKMAEIMGDAKAQEDAARVAAAVAIAEATAIKAQAADALAEAEMTEEEAKQMVAEAEARAEEARQHAADVTAETAAMEDDAFAQAEAVRRSAKRQEEEAMARAAEVERQADEIEAMAVVRAVNAMVRARVIENAAAREAIKAIIEANVIEAGAAREAVEALRYG
jgi:uncharacterized membrane protein